MLFLTGSPDLVTRCDAAEYSACGGDYMYYCDLCGSQVCQNHIIPHQVELTHPKGLCGHIGCDCYEGGMRGCATLEDRAIGICPGCLKGKGVKFDAAKERKELTSFR